MSRFYHKNMAFHILYTFIQSNIHLLNVIYCCIYTVLQKSHVHRYICHINARNILYTQIIPFAEKMLTLDPVCKAPHQC